MELAVRGLHFYPDKKQQMSPLAGLNGTRNEVFPWQSGAAKNEKRDGLKVQGVGLGNLPAIWSFLDGMSGSNAIHRRLQLRWSKSPESGQRVTALMAVFCQEKRHCTRSSTPQYQEIFSKPCSLADSGSFVSITEPQSCLSRKDETIGPRYWAALWYRLQSIVR